MPTSQHVRPWTVLLLLILGLLGASCASGEPVLTGDTAKQPDETPTAPAAPEPAEPDDNDVDDNDVDDSDAEQTLTTEAEEQPTEPAAADADDPQIELVRAGGGASDVFNYTQISVLAATSTNSDAEALLRGEPRVDCCDRFPVVVELGLENLINRYWVLSRNNVVLQSPSGEQFAATKALDNQLSSESAFTFLSRDIRGARLVFEMDELVEDLAEWHLLVTGLTGDENWLPLVLPLEGPGYAHTYPISLTDGARGEFDTERCAEGGSLATHVTGIHVAIDDPGAWDDWLVGREDPERAGIGERLVAIELDVSGQGTTDEFGEDCGSSTWWPDFVLVADGFDASGIRSHLQDVDVGATSPNYLVFKIPAETQRLELLAGKDRSAIGSWDVDLPAEVGEGGTALVRDSRLQATSVLPDPGPRPDELTSQVLTQGGASGTILGADVSLNSVTATNATLSSFVSDRSELDERNTYVVAEVEAMGTADTDWSLWRQHFILVDPDGRPHGGIDLFDQLGADLSTADIQGAQRKVFQVAFQTDGLVTDPTGWSLFVENGDDVALVLPLQGESQPAGFPIALASAQAADLSYDGCEISLNANIANAVVDLEGPRHTFGVFDLNVARVDPKHRAVVIDLELANPGTVDGPGDSIRCVALQYWPEFLLEVDGQQLSPYRYGWPDVDPGTTTLVPLHYEIPKDSQTASLLFQDQVLATWQLKNPTQVLSDLGAQSQDERTLITLDETVLFGFGEAALQQGAVGPLTRIASVINSESTGDIEIIGHTDSIGDDASNNALSLARAEAVAAALVTAGVDEDRLVVSGLGESSPVAPNETEDGSDNPAGRAENRRVEVLFSTADQ